MKRQIFSQVYKNVVTFISWPGELALILVYPLIGILSLGLFGSFVIEGGVASEAFVFIIYGVLSWNIYSVGQQSMTRGVLYEIWNSTLKSMFATRIKIKEFVLGNVVFSLMNISVIFILVSSISWLVFNFNIFSAGPLLVVGILGILLQAYSESLLIMSLLMKFGQKFGSLSWILPGIMMVICGVYYPIELLPESVRYVSNILPATHAIIGIRNLVINPGLAMNELSTSILIGVIYLAITISILKLTIGLAKRDGSLAKLTEG